MDETYIRVAGQWNYLYRAVDSTGAPIDFWLSAERDAAAAKRFFQRALKVPGRGRPRFAHRTSLPEPPRFTFATHPTPLLRQLLLEMKRHASSVSLLSVGA